MVQTVARPCVLCSERIATAADGTHCAECETVFHAACIAAAQDVCPRCRRRRVPPEEREVRARFCTGCLLLYDEPRSACRDCGERMVFADRAAYERWVTAVRAHGRRDVVWGSIVLLAAGLAAAAYFVLLLGLTPSGSSKVFQSLILFAVVAGAFGLHRVDRGRKLSASC